MMKVVCSKRVEIGLLEQFCREGRSLELAADNLKRCSARCAGQEDCPV